MFKDANKTEPEIEWIILIKPDNVTCNNRSKYCRLFSGFPERNGLLNKCSELVLKC